MGLKGIKWRAATLCSNGRQGVSHPKVIRDDAVLIALSAEASARLH